MPDTSSLQSLLDQLDSDNNELARLAEADDWDAFSRRQRERDRRFAALDDSIHRALEAGSFTSEDLRQRLLQLRSDNTALMHRADTAKAKLEQRRAELEHSTRAVKAYRREDSR